METSTAHPYVKKGPVTLDPLPTTLEPIAYGRENSDRVVLLGGQDSDRQQVVSAGSEVPGTPAALLRGELSDRRGRQHFLRDPVGPQRRDLGRAHAAAVHIRRQVVRAIHVARCSSANAAEGD